MNRKDAKLIAQTITNEQIQEMFYNARANITDWTKTSICNKGCTKGVAWNILANGFDVTKPYHPIAKVNMVREFGDYLPDELKPLKKSKKEFPPPTHHDPIF